MQSDSYIIYENVHHVFDGPVISGVSAAVSAQTATVSWSTDVAADAFVVYSTDPAFGTSREQGTSAKTAGARSVMVSGLDPATTYHYRVRSERINGGITTDIAPRSFVTEAAASVPSPSAGGGGGILVIDKTDKAPPVVSNAVVASVGADSFTIEWETDEEATSFVEYGPGAAFGNVYGRWGTSTAHRVTIERLSPETEYSWRAVSSDGWGNVGYSERRTAITLPSGEEEPAAEEEEAGEAETPPLPEGLSALAQNALEFLQRLFPFLDPEELDNIRDLLELSDYMDTPSLVGEPLIEAGAGEAVIRWQTNIEANSMVALSPDSAYDPAAADPYRQIIGNPNDYSTSHELTMHGLTPDTTYHLQIRSAAPLGPDMRSGDYTFLTSQEELQIVSYLTQIVDNETAIFKWVTNKEADSSLTFTPYFNGVLGLDQQKTVKDNARSVVHEIRIGEFVGGTFYEIEILSGDERGNEARKIISQFSTTEDDLPPAISHIKADSTVFVDQSDKIQTIISWLTNEPSTSQVYYQEGVHSPTAELAEKTGLNSNYTREHVVLVSKFKPGLVYSFRVESIDSGGNVTTSKLHTFMTAKKKESIITIIMNILENTFGWLKKLM